MEALVFPSEEALQVALRTGLIPAELQRAPARAGAPGMGSLRSWLMEPLALNTANAAEPTVERNQVLFSAG